jgi:hemerythrin-like metal-binding protein
MDRFTWVPGFDVGIEKMNSQHRALFQKMQDLDNLNHKSAPKANVLAAFDELLHLTEQHFASEEKTMQDLGFVAL